MCRNYVKISEYIDGLLSNVEKTSFEEHLEQCSACMITYKNYKTMVRSLGSLEPPKVSDNFADSLFARIDSIVHPSFTELSAYRDNIIEDKKIAEHVVDCISCQDIVESINQEVKFVSNLPEYNVSDNFFDNLMTKIDNIESFDDKSYDDNFLSGVMAKIEDLPLTELEENHISLDDLSAYFDEEETSVSYFEIESHLGECAKCSSKYTGFRFTGNLIAELEHPDVPFDFSRKVIKEIENQESKVIKFIPYFKKFVPRASMVAGIIIAGVLVTLSRTQIEQPQEQMAKITVRSEDYLFEPSTVSYRTDSIDVLADNKQDDSLQIQDIGL